MTREKATCGAPRPSQDVQASLESFEEMDTDRWTGWVAYLLEGLERLRPDEAERVPRDVRESVEERLEARGW